MGRYTVVAVVAVFFAFVALVVGRTLFKIRKYGGLAPAGFGARIEQTVGEFDVGKGMRVKVHKLCGSPDKAIGIEFESYALPVLEIALSASEARKLATFIRSAVGGNAL